MKSEYLIVALAATAALAAAAAGAAPTISPELARKLVEARPKPSGAASRPAGTRRGEMYRVLKFTPAKPEQIRAFRRRAQEWARQTRKEVTKDLRLVETAHFLIYTTWPTREHRPLAARCEAMYRALCKQFDIPPTLNVWAGKLPIFMFWKKEQFNAFTTKIDKVGGVRAGGYNVQKGDGFTYVVLSHTQTKTRFYEVLIHESTHAFLGRYLTNRIVPRWANEGLAEYMAAKLVKDTESSKRHYMATRLAVARNADISGVFSGRHLSNLGYGIVHSLVRYMAATDRKGFLRFIRLIKEGKSEVDALKEGMGLTHAELAAKWRDWARKSALEPPPRRPRRR